MTPEAMYRHLKQGVEELTKICGKAPTCSAAPGWKANEAMLMQKEKFPFRYNSDCRGCSVFVPEVDGQRLLQPQLPVTLPTYDEIIGRNGITHANFNEHLLSLIHPEKLNVLTIHAEVEGIACREMFDNFLQLAAERGIQIVPTGDLVSNENDHCPSDRVTPRTLPGREGWIAFQESLPLAG